MIILPANEAMYETDFDNYWNLLSQVLEIQIDPERSASPYNRCILYEVWAEKIMAE